MGSWEQGVPSPAPSPGADAERRSPWGTPGQQGEGVPVLGGVSASMIVSLLCARLASSIG